ncbi:GreA/GreB family elongation factor [Oleiagrimonas sp. MCCC 1A03011]|uniref:GreA/GreB family elongation factor n=1 Tax=Oleiagrimonas sp. MCCC 1A03011 TaxID=1926883 RepID=UPI000DC33D06|nr:GreA/GreB family elongation factor [Oleiagrimonas sp. MCCC 1A03011]RAP59427.1 transcription elongation factor GreAB [Oleiagrimonas sp. MCCC 1A03011]
MSRAFVKESDSPAGSELPERPISSHPNYVTPSGLAKLRALLEDAQARKHVLSAAEDDIEARAELQAVKRDLRWLEARVGSARVVDPAGQPRDRVAFGATVEVADDEGEHTYRIVGEDEADAEEGLVSYVSPLAKALLGAKVGDEVVWKRPAGDRVIEVLGIDYTS